MRRPVPSNASTSIRWSTTTCPAWTTTCCAAAGRPATSNTTNRPHCWWATACNPWLSTFCRATRKRLRIAARQLEMVRLLARASGSCGMAGGQAIDLASVGKPLTQPELELMHALKTGALIRAAVLLGALAGQALTADERSKLDRFAKRAGLLFQVVDDILDCTASTDNIRQNRRQGRSGRQANLRQPAGPRRRTAVCQRTGSRSPAMPRPLRHTQPATHRTGGLYRPPEILARRITRMQTR